MSGRDEPLARLDAAFATDAFARRHIGPSDAEIRHMLDIIGVESVSALIERTVPAEILTDMEMALPPAVDEAGCLREMRELAGHNQVLRSLIGAGYYGTVMPPVLQRNVFENPGWYTAYTPYQAEIAQGRLEALLNFQTMICDLTGMEIANASLLDEGTAVAEAVMLARAVGRGKSDAVAVAADLHPQTLAVLRTRLDALGLKLVRVAPGAPEAVARSGAFAVVLNYPGTTGAVRDLRGEIEAAHAAGGLAIVAADLLALTVLTPPGEMGADVVVGSAQRFGVPMGFGGPHAAYFATREAYRRAMPGRLVGVSVDRNGNRALRLALQTREQHIRREKATSNICTAQVLLAVLAGFYAVWHGPEGLRGIAGRVALMARIFSGAIERAGLSLRYRAFFDTVAFDCADVAAADAWFVRAAAAGFNWRRLDGAGLAVAFDETVTREELATLCALLGETVRDDVDSVVGLPDDMRRQTPVLRHEVFHAYQSEHAMLRYLSELEGRDLALNRGMIPLGSCTMKLNAAVEMMPLSWPEFADLHPFAPANQTAGYRELIARLQTYLAVVTGMDAVSVQPNAGSQGEYAGLLAIRAFHAARGEVGRDVCLIPASAHGTNPASATMAGLRVVVVGCDRDGNIDGTDLAAKIATHGERLAAMMLTYPSTHGVFEAGVVRMIDAVHAAGGQVYMDGANLNAQLGLTSPGAIGADVCHLNLHKTFCIPHGGGGPGVGPIAVKAHLAPHLPNHPLDEMAGPVGGLGAISAAPFGSALILPIAYAYIRLMGAKGLKRATEIAILNANYVATRLRRHYDILYTGAAGFVAHECILDCRRFAEAKVQVEDIAKRLQDYGFHAPTMSWPVPGTLMVEPTESENLAELDRFCAAMVAIAEEIAAISDPEDNLLRNAPHTQAEICASDWRHSYTREAAAFPVPMTAKYWPSVARVDNVYGDRNLFCTCAAPLGLAEAAD